MKSDGRYGWFAARVAVAAMFVSAVGFSGASAQSIGAFSATGTMSTPRFAHTATLLGNGRVLIAGGASAIWAGPDVIEATAELYDPSTGSFIPTGSMTVPRWGHTATLLRDGTVLIFGGSGGATAEVYDPVTGAFTATGTMISTSPYVAAVLADQRVLVVDGVSVTAELYDPSTRTFARTGDMVGPAADTATVLTNGTVLVTKSLVWNANRVAHVRHAELYDPSTGTFARTGDLVEFHSVPTATLLHDGTVLIAGGDIGEGDGASSVAELYDPATGAFSLTGRLREGRQDHTATLRSDGTVLFTGGHGSVPYPGGGYSNLSSAESYDPAVRGFRAAATMGTGRGRHAATLLSNRSVLITGGAEYYPCCAGDRPPVYGLLSSAELYTGGDFQSLPFTGTPVAVPRSIIEAENYDTGAMDVAYKDLTPGNTGGKYRVGDVDIEQVMEGSDPVGFNIGWMSAGEWLQYSIDVGLAGRYTLVARIASDGGGGTFHVEVNRVPITGTLQVPDTGGWQQWQTVTATVTLAAGVQQLRVVLDTNGSTGAVGNLDHLRLTASPPETPPSFTVAAESFAGGGQGCWQGPFQCGGGHYDQTAGNWGDAQVRPGTDVDLWYDDGGIVIGGLDGLEWVTFPVNVPQSGRYDVTFRTASPADRPAGSGVINVGIYGVDASWVGNQVVPVTGGPGEWHSYVTWDAPITIYLPAGSQTLTMWSTGGWYNVRRMTFMLAVP
jgi:hypothetical protein